MQLLAGHDRSAIRREEAIVGAKTLPRRQAASHRKAPQDLLLAIDDQEAIVAAVCDQQVTRECAVGDRAPERRRRSKECSRRMESASRRPQQRHRKGPNPARQAPSSSSALAEPLWRPASATVTDRRTTRRPRRAAARLVRRGRGRCPAGCAIGRRRARGSGFIPGQPAWRRGSEQEQGGHPDSPASSWSHAGEGRAGRAHLARAPGASAALLRSSRSIASGEERSSVANIGAQLHFNPWVVWNGSQLLRALAAGR